MVLCFGAAASAAGYGVFSRTSETVIFGLAFPPGSVPIFVVLALLGGVGALFAGLGAPQCRRCGKPLKEANLSFARSDEDRVMKAVNRSAPEQLPPASQSEGTSEVVVELSYCDGCKEVVIVRALQRARVPEADELVEAELRPATILSGPTARAWVAELEQRLSN
jgi:hypothetical protein